MTGISVVVVVAEDLVHRMNKVKNRVAMKVVAVHKGHATADVVLYVHEVEIPSLKLQMER